MIGLWIAVGVLAAQNIAMAWLIRRLYRQVHGINRRTWRVTGPIG